MDYIFIPMVNYLLFGIFFSAAIPEVYQRIVWILLLLTIVTFINIKGVKLAASTNVIIIGFSLLFIIVFAVLSIKSIMQGEGTGMLLNIEPFFQTNESFTYM